ncbi:MAG: glycosyltransferase [Candidatus Cloacimonadaceae bacterium]|nr:glycosyltransferase [Candidatus Cloacimonadaceae bacterium]
MEYHLSTASGFTKKVNAYFFDHLSYGFCDGVIPISHYLEDVVRKRFTHKPTLILPVLADYHISVDTADSLTLISELGAQKYFLYCAGIGYRDTCEFVTRSFIELGNPDVKLVMVLSGHPRSIAEFRNQYEKYGNIVVLSDLTYSQLYSCYQNALALLVPLREQRKDEARFPQKIAEYLSSARPIITNGFGEINFHFRDKDNAFVVDNYNESMFCEAMNFVLNNPKIAEGIGLRGREYGLSHFHYQVHSTRLMSFIESL